MSEADPKSSGQSSNRTNGPAETGGNTSENQGWARGWTAWAVIAILFVAFVFVPWGLILLPTVQDSVRVVGFSFRDAYLVLPLLPALGLGALGVWTALRSRRS